MAYITIGNCFRTTWRLHGCAEGNTNGLAEFLLTIQFIPAFIVHPLTEKFNRRLGAILFFHRHVEIINKNDGFLANFWAPYTLTTSIHATIDYTLSLVSGGLSREGQTKVSPVIVLEAIVKLVED